MPCKIEKNLAFGTIMNRKRYLGSKHQIPKLREGGRIVTAQRGGFLALPLVFRLVSLLGSNPLKP